MNLAEYMKSHGIGDAALGKKIGEKLNPKRVVPRVTVRQWRLGLRRPQDEATLAALRAATGGRVTANDFYMVKP